MKKETQNISKNTSSGAEKVEKIEKEIKKKTTGGKTTTAKRVTTREESAKGDAALGDSVSKTVEKPSVKKHETTIAGKAEAESAAAKARVEAAIQRKEAKEKRKAERMARAAKRREERAKRAAEFKAKIAKRNATRKAEIEKRAAAKKAKIEKRKAEKEEKLRQRAHAKANRKQAHAKKRVEKSKRNKQRENRERQENKGYGGWIAAVVALGVTTLALATTVTVGAVEMKNATNSAMSAYRGTMYELTGILESVENDLDRARVSDSSAQQSRILTDLLVQARLAELDVEKLPVEAEADRNITVFVNRTAAECERMLAKLRNGEQLSVEDRAIIERLYQTNHAIREEINNLVSNMTDKDLMNFVKKGKGMVADTMKKLEKMTLEENRVGAEKPAQAPAPQQNEKDGEKPSRIEAARAEELCAQYFQSYNLKEYQCVGETVSHGHSAYNVQARDDKGTLLFAEVSQDNGALVRFDFFEECNGETFDLQNAERIAEDFLEKLGYDDMEIVRCRQNGSTSDFTFVYEEDGVVYYPDEIHVKVCRTRGVVSGMDASKYLKNHRGRYEVNVKLPLAEAYEKLYDGLDVEAARVAVIQTARGEKTAYEMLCSYATEKYLIYLDAITGEEISIININTLQ